MRKTPAILPLLSAILPVLAAGTGSANGGAMSAEKYPVEFPRGKPAYVVASLSTDLEKRVSRRLTGYLRDVLSKPAKVVRTLDSVPKRTPAIILVGKDARSPFPVQAPKDNEESFVLVTGKVGDRAVVVAAGNTDKGLKRAVQRLIIKSEQGTDALVIPELNLSESPWIPHREWTLCPWVPEFVRGVFKNPSADKRFNLFRYADKRLADYVEMLDWFGFSGCQLMETCYNYRMMGSIEAAQTWQRKMAGFLRDNGQEVSLWAWAAQFTGFGWTDQDVIYNPEKGKSAYEDPNVRRTFDRYYDHYAELAPYVDRFIGHFYDPGQLSDRSDVFQYMRLLEGKLKEKNPKIEMGIDCWSTGAEYLAALADNGFKDYLILPSGFPEAFTPGIRESLHEQARKLGLKLGIWGWYITEYETDQLASMYVNARLMKSLYTQMRDGALKIHPVEYWSEMEAHHLNNIYSMYASSQLLWNPDGDPQEILAELTSGIWGPKNGLKVLNAVDLIQDVRTGSKWEEYWWRYPECRLGTEDAESDLKRATQALSDLQNLRTDTSFVLKFPLPYPPETFVELMIPHIKQIKLFAEFRVKVEKLREAARAGADKPTLEKMLTEAWQPVPEFSTWVGTFGLVEIREQKKIVTALNKEYGLNVKDPKWLVVLEADRILQGLQNRQLGSTKPIVFSRASPNGEFYWPEGSSADRFAKLIADGAVTKVGEDQYQLTDWGKWAGVQ